MGPQKDHTEGSGELPDNTGAEDVSEKFQMRRKKSDFNSKKSGIYDKKVLSLDLYGREHLFPKNFYMFYGGKEL